MTIQQQLDQRLTSIEELYDIVPPHARAALLDYVHAIETSAETIATQFKLFVARDDVSRHECGMLRAQCILAKTIMEVQIDALFTQLVQQGIDPDAAAMIFKIGKPLRDVELEAVIPH